MKNTIIIVLIAVLAMVAIMLGVFIAIMPEPVPEEPVDIHTANSLIESLGINKPNTRLERLMVIRTYQGVKNVDELIADMIKIGQVGNLEYWETNDKGEDYLLIVPFEINGKMKISSLKFDSYNEVYVPDQTKFLANGGKELPDNYSLLIRYSRPDVPELEVKLLQDDGNQTATYQITNSINGEPVTTTQFIKDDIEQGVDSVGTERISLVKE